MIAPACGLTPFFCVQGANWLSGRLAGIDHAGSRLKPVPALLRCRRTPSGATAFAPKRPGSGSAFGSVSDEGAAVGGQVWQALALATSFGLTAALLVAGGVVGGRWVDGRLGTTPLFAVVGLFLGLGTGGYLFIRQVTRILGGSGRDR